MSITTQELFELYKNYLKNRKSSIRLDIDIMETLLFDDNTFYKDKSEKNFVIYAIFEYSPKMVDPYHFIILFDYNEKIKLKVQHIGKGVDISTIVIQQENEDFPIILESTILNSSSPKKILRGSQSQISENFSLGILGNTMNDFKFSYRNIAEWSLRWWYKNDYLSGNNNTQFPASCNGLVSTLLLGISKRIDLYNGGYLYDLSKIEIKKEKKEIQKLKKKK